MATPHIPLLIDEPPIIVERNGAFGICGHRTKHFMA